MLWRSGLYNFTSGTSKAADGAAVVGVVDVVDVVAAAAEAAGEAIAAATGNRKTTRQEARSKLARRGSGRLSLTVVQTLDYVGKRFLLSKARRRRRRMAIHSGWC